MRRPFAFLLSGLFAFALLAAAVSTAPVSALSTIAAPTTSCANGEDDTPGLGLICQVSIVNRINSSGGSATVTVRECHGAAGVPETACTTTTTSLTQPVTGVTQCNASINGGGGTLRCSVWVINNFYGGLSPTTSAVTANQCVGSGDGIANNCDPFPATTTGAAVTQCNGSANGGTLVRLECTATGTTTSSNAVTINQCNGSANGGGSLVICSAKITNNIVAVTPAPTASGGSGATATPRPTTPSTSTSQFTPARSGTDLVILAGLFLVSALSLITVFKRQTR